MLSLCKESKYAAAKSSIILTSYWEFLSFDLMIPNSHKNIEMILIEKGSGNQLPPNDVYKSMYDEYHYSSKTSSENPTFNRKYKGLIQ